MSDAPTPGQINYETYQCDCGCWRDLEDVVQQRWEAAAQAVLALAQEEEGPDPDRATLRTMAWSRALALLVDQIRQLPHEPEIVSELETVWTLLHQLRETDHA